MPCMRAWILALIAAEEIPTRLRRLGTRPPPLRSWGDTKALPNLLHACVDRFFQTC